MLPILGTGNFATVRLGISRSASHQHVAVKIVEKKRFDASDLMPEQMNAAFLQGVLDFVRNPGALDDVLAGLDEVQRRVNSGDSFLRP